MLTRRQARLAAGQNGDQAPEEGGTNQPTKSPSTSSSTPTLARSPQPGQWTSLSRQSAWERVNRAETDGGEGEAWESSHITESNNRRQRSRRASAGVFLESLRPQPKPSSLTPAARSLQSLHNSSALSSSSSLLSSSLPYTSSSAWGGGGRPRALKLGAANPHGHNYYNHTHSAYDETALPAHSKRPLVFPHYVLTTAMAEEMRRWTLEGSTGGVFVIEAANQRPVPLSARSGVVKPEAEKEAVKDEEEAGPDSSLTGNWLAAIKREGDEEAAAGRPRARVTGTQAKQAWRGCVRDLTTLTHPAAQTHGTKLALKPIHTSSSSSSALSSVAPTQHALLEEKQKRVLPALQAGLAHEVPHFHHLQAHRKRMELLLGRHNEEQEGSGNGNSNSNSNEEAYLKMLDPSRSQKEENILRVVAAIDKQVSAQMQSVYQERDSNCAKEKDDEQEESEAQQHTEKYTGCLSSHRRLEFINALISLATTSLPAFTRMLMPYQQEGVRWLLHLNFIERMNGILADDMGLGKTAQSVVYITCYKVLVEDVVGRQLTRLLSFTRAVLTQSWVGLVATYSRSVKGTSGAVSSSGETGLVSVSAEAAHAYVRAVMANVAAEQLEREKITNSSNSNDTDNEDDGVVLPALRVLWPQLSAEESDEVLACGEGRDTAQRDGVSTVRAILEVELRPYLRATRALKQVRQWVWQLEDRDAAAKDTEQEDEDEEEMEEKREKQSVTHSSGYPSSSSLCSARRATGTTAPSSSSSSSRQRKGSPPRMKAHVRRRVAPHQLTLQPRKRGRPSKADLAARAAAAAADFAGAGVGQTEHTNTNAFGSFSASMETDVWQARRAAAEAEACAFFRAACAVPGYTRATNAALEQPQTSPMLPILVIAPLSTLPHWKKEFTHFQAASHVEVYMLNGTREARDAETQRFLRHVKTRDEATGASTKATTAAGGVEAESAKGASASARRRKARKQSSNTANDGDQLESDDSPLAAADAVAAKLPVLLIPHDLLVRHGLSLAQRRIAHVHFHLVIIDEAQRIKNSQGGLFSRVCRLSSLSRLALTGTPLQNNIVELFSLLQFLAPQAFHARRHQGLLEQLDEALAEASRSHALEDVELHILLCRRVHRLLAPFILRRDKSVIRAMLPAKKDFTIVCPLMPYQQTKLDEVEAKHAANELSGNPNILRRKILLHPYTMLPYFFVDSGMLSASGKLLVLDFMMQFLVRTGHKFLIFCGWTLVLDVVETLCQMRQLPYVRLDGKTSVEDREAHIASFNSSSAASTTKTGSGEGVTGAKGGGENVEGTTTSNVNANPCCFLISKVAGGVGLNLQSADTVFLLDVDYNPQRDNQALSRVYRVGQTKEVRVFRLLVDHASERGVVAIHTAKENLDKAVVQAGKYDLHTSSGEKEAALQKLFSERSTAEMKSDGDGDGSGANNATASPSNPSSPLFPFGCDEAVEEAVEECGGSPNAQGEGSSSFADFTIPAEQQQQWRQQHQAGSLPPVVVVAASPTSPTPPIESLLSDESSSPTTASSPTATGKAFRRVRFALPDESEEKSNPTNNEDYDENSNARSGVQRRGPVGRKGVSFSDGGFGGGEEETEGSGEGEVPASPRTARRAMRLEREAAEGEQEIEVPLADRLLALRESLLQALPRSAHESVVLADMFREKEAEAERERAAHRRGGGGGARRQRTQ